MRSGAGRVWTVAEIALAVILLMLGYTSRMISDVIDLIINLTRNVDVNLNPAVEVHLGPNRMVPQQCTDTDTGVPYFEQLMWQEQREPLLEGHSRLLAFRRRPRYILPVNETTNSRPERPKCASVDIGTQTTPDLGIVVDRPPTELVPHGMTTEGNGTMDIHGNQPAGDAEVPDNHPASMAVPRTADSGYGSEPLSSQAQGQNQAQGEGEKIGEACFIEGVSKPPASQGDIPTGDDFKATAYDPDVVDGNIPSQMEDPD